MWRYSRYDYRSPIWCVVRSVLVLTNQNQARRNAGAVNLKSTDYRERKQKKTKGNHGWWRPRVGTQQGECAATQDGPGNWQFVSCITAQRHRFGPPAKLSTVSDRSGPVTDFLKLLILGIDNLDNLEFIIFSLCHSDTVVTRHMSIEAVPKIIPNN